jgi:hypothetical protein
MEFGPTWNIFARGKNTETIDASMEINSSIVEEFKVKLYPTIYAVDKEGQKHIFEGPRTLSRLQEFAERF